MLSIDFIRENPEKVKEAAKNKNCSVDVDRILELDRKRRELIQKIQKVRQERNKLAMESITEGKREQGRKIKEEMKVEEKEFEEIKKELDDLLLQVPNVAADDVPVGKDETGNKEVKKVGKIPEFPFQPRSHEELAIRLNLFDTKRAAKIAGSRAFFLMGDLVILEQALLGYGLDFMREQGFVPMTVPWMVHKEALWGTGYFPWGVDDHYTTQDGQGLIGTSEVSITAFHQDEVLSEQDLPVKYVGISPCFRREVGSYGKDTQGFFRVHQFNKVEQVVLTIADEEETRNWHEKMLAFSEEVLRQLNLPYRVLLMCTGDMGAGQKKKYDIETWFPAQQKYRETHSASYFNDFQSRRLNIRYRSKHGEVKYVYTLNNTVIATPRLLAAILENNQQKDGSVLIPKVLQPLVGFDKIVPHV